MRYFMLAALLLVGCGGDDTKGSSSSNPSAGGGGTGGGAGGAGGEGAGTVSSKCDTPADAPHVDALSYVGRAEGPTFIEILDVVQAHPIVYACTSVQGLNVWDASNDPPTLLINRIDPLMSQFPHCQNLALDPMTNRIAFANRGDELQPQPWVWVGDFSTPGSPVPVAGYQTGTEALDGVDIRGDRVWAAAHSAGILVLDITGSGAGGLTVTSRYSDADSDAWQPLWHNNHLLVAEGATGVRIYDVSGDTPSLVSTVPIQGSSKDIVVHDDIAYVAASSRIVSIDVSDPANPQLLGETETTGTAVALAIGLNDTLLVAEWEKLRGYDIADPANMVPELSEVMPPGAPDDPYSRILAVDAAPDFERAYPAEWHGLHVYDQTPCGVGPDLEASPDSVQFGTVAPMGLDVRALILRNNGNRPLQITDITGNDPALSLNETSVTIEPGEGAAVEISFSPSSTATLNGLLQIVSDDLDESPFDVIVSGNIPGIDVGDPLPMFSLQDTDGNTWDNGDLQGKVAVLAYFATF